MNKYKLIIVLIWSNVWLMHCVPRRKKSDITQKYHRTGEAIVMDYIIHNYEKEHQKFFKGETKDGNQFQWPALKNKDLSNYCNKYLQHAVPTRNTDYAIGIKMKLTLLYEKENISINNDIVSVMCKVIYKSHQLVYYMTRAPEPNCVYALKSTGNPTKFIFTIIHKHCNFENKTFIMPRKRKSSEIIMEIHPNTGQPIARNEHLLQYELEHQELLKKEGDGDICINWPFAVVHPNLDFYCYQYVGKCSPNRCREGIRGYWKSNYLLYQQLDKNVKIKVTTITCQTPLGSKRHYHITRAPEINCVYALLQKGRGPGKSLVIIFKHCDFEEVNVQQIISCCHDTLHKNIFPITDVKKEMSDTLETLELFPAV